jgi:hypothetical protein
MHIICAFSESKHVFLFLHFSPSKYSFYSLAKIIIAAKIVTTTILRVFYSILIYNKILSFIMSNLTLKR